MHDVSGVDLAVLKAAALAVVGYRAYSDQCGAGSVASALVSGDGSMFTGVCVDANSSIGFCAEHAAIAEMLKHRQSRIVAIVAVDGDGRVRPPCGRCRELIRQLDRDNWHTAVVVSDNAVAPLSELLPFSKPVEPAVAQPR